WLLVARRKRRRFACTDPKESRLEMTAQPDIVTVGLVQMRCDPEPEANLDKAVTRIQQAAAGGAQIICLQELFRSLYFCQREDPQLFDLAEPIPGPSSEQLSRVARQPGTVIVASLFERRTAGVYHNTAVVFDAHRRL